MKLGTVDKLLWAYGFLQNLALLSVLLWRGRARSFPCFTALIAFGTLRTLVLFTVFTVLGMRRTYTVVYWVAAAIDLLLQSAVVYEVARKTFHRAAAWVPGAKQRFAVLAGCAPITGFAFACLMTPAAKTALDAWDARANLFMTVTICFLVTAVMMVSRQLGVGWNQTVLRFSAGLGVWSISAFVMDALHAYWRTSNQFSVLENVMSCIYLLVTLYWIVLFWNPELEPLPQVDSDRDRRDRVFQVAKRLQRD